MSPATGEAIVRTRFVEGSVAPSASTIAQISAVSANAPGAKPKSIVAEESSFACRTRFETDGL